MDSQMIVRQRGDIFRKLAAEFLDPVGDSFAERRTTSVREFLATV
jgi:hypothetical protein